ncbi:MAG TPA: PIN domain protein [Verrucomicrobiales bacterium]|nr:PIN domain protein [Verrucomicrobiales bacterium]
MKAPTLYLDTSTIGGYYDAEWMEDTRELWHQAQAGKWCMLTSIITEREIENAPEQVRQLFEETFCDAAALLAETEESEDLAQEYLRADVVSAKFADDARHVAICTVNRVNHLVSWNFKHLVNVRREAGFNAVNLLQGYQPVSIVNPKELIYANIDDES